MHRTTPISYRPQWRVLSVEAAWRSFSHSLQILWHAFGFAKGQNPIYNACIYNVRCWSKTPDL